MKDNLISLTNNPYEIYIQFFLPVKYLYEKVEQWKLKDEFGDFNDDIAEKHVVSVRSYDRLKNSGSIGLLRLGMKRFKECLSLNNQTIRDKFHHLQEFNCDESKQLTHSLKEKIGIKFICPVSMSENNRIEIFKAIIKSGIPIAVWIRTDKEVDLKNEIEEILTTASVVSPPRALSPLHSNPFALYSFILYPW